MTRESPVQAALAAHVGRTVARLQAMYARGVGEQPTSQGAQVLAALRRADPGSPGDDPAVWGAVFDGMPTEVIGHGDDPSRAERAAHGAICLYALHQQSHSDPVHRLGARPGQAFGRLARARATGHDSLNVSVVARVHAASTANTSAKRLHELRGLISLLRAETPTIQIDYGRLAVDLYRLSWPRSAPSVRLAWARDLHGRPVDSAGDGALTTVHDSTTPSSPESTGAI